MTDERARKRRRPLIRVFVSSTFSDLKLERDALQQRVFPKLEQRCLAEGFQFQAIDLRWGVSTEAGLDHRTMRICFEELRRSQEVSPEPNFLILLGNRYGWRPLPEEISEEEFRELNKAASGIDATVTPSRPCICCGRGRTAPTARTTRKRQTRREISAILRPGSMCRRSCGTS
jgi:hypothetical protein